MKKVFFSALLVVSVAFTCGIVTANQNLDSFNADDEVIDYEYYEATTLVNSETNFDTTSIIVPETEVSQTTVTIAVTSEVKETTTTGESTSVGTIQTETQVDTETETQVDTETETDVEWYESELNGFEVWIDSDGNLLEEKPNCPPVSVISEDITTYTTSNYIETVQTTKNVTNNDEEPEYGSDAYLLAYAMAREADWGNDTDAYYVGCVILNRVDDSDFPNTIYGVLTEEGQYPWNDDYYFSRSKIYDTHLFEIAYNLLNGYRPLPKSVVYQAQFIQGSGIYTTVGVHYYCYK